MRKAPRCGSRTGGRFCRAAMPKRVLGRCSFRIYWGGVIWDSAGIHGNLWTVVGSLRHTATLRAFLETDRSYGNKARRAGLVRGIIAVPMARRMRRKAVGEKPLPFVDLVRTRATFGTSTISSNARQEAGPDARQSKAGVTDRCINDANVSDIRVIQRLIECVLQTPIARSSLANRFVLVGYRVHGPSPNWYKGVDNCTSPLTRAIISRLLVTLALRQNCRAQSNPWKGKCRSHGHARGTKRPVPCWIRDRVSHNPQGRGRSCSITW